MDSQFGGYSVRVLYVLSITWGAIPQYTAELANAVAKYADVTVLKSSGWNDGLFSGDLRLIDVFKPVRLSRGREIRAFSPKNLKNMFSYRNIRMVNELEPDVVHFPGVYLHASIFARLFGLDRRYPIVHTIHSVLDSHLKSVKKRGLLPVMLSIINYRGKTISRPIRTIVHTEANKTALVKEGISTDSIVVIPHGAYSHFTGYSDDDHVTEENAVLFFGYITPNKGLEHLVQAVGIACTKIPGLKLIVAGEGRLPSSLSHLDDVSMVEVHNEFIPHEEVSRLFRRAKIVALPYVCHQGHSGVLTVAYSFGKPVVVTDVGDLPNLVENRKEGIVVPSRDSQALAEAIIKLLKDDKLRKQMGENAAKKAEELSWDNIAKRHLEVYKEAIDEHNSKKR